MCHHRDYDRTRSRTRDDREDEDEDLPGFLNEEASDEMEVLTDGGDEDDES